MTTVMALILPLPARIPTEKTVNMSSPIPKQSNITDILPSSIKCQVTTVVESGMMLPYNRSH